MTSARTSVRSPGQLTTRQREVLALVAKGRTNGEIASELGIGFDTAKTHVSEILGRLGVDTREEAADWWRRENGLAARLFRVLGFSALPVASRFAVAASALAVLGVGAAVVVLALNPGDGQPASGGPASLPTVNVPVTVTGSTTPDVAATASTTPAAGSPTALLQDFQQGAPIDLPAGLALYYSWAGIEGPRQNLWRAYRNRSGSIVTEELFQHLPDHPEGIAGSAYDLATGRVAVLLCLKGYCGGYGEAQPDSEATLVLSSDGGTSWSDPVDVPVGWIPVAFTGDQLVVFRDTMRTAGQSEYELYPSGKPLTVPLGASPQQLATGELVFLDGQNGVVYDASGAVVFESPNSPRLQGTSALVQAGSLNWAIWFEESNSFVGEVAGSAMTRIFRAPNLTVVPYWPIASGVVAGRLDSDSPGSGARTPVIFDLNNGRFHELTGVGTVAANSWFVAVGAWHGNFARAMPGAGECLNVRETPALSGMMVTCVPDGVLLRLSGNEQSTDGISWFEVKTARGDQGWASSDFLR